MTDKREDIPVVLTAFGTTAKAFATYEKMDRVFKQTLPDTQIHWAYSSRMVKRAMQKNHQLDLKDPLETLQFLADQGHPWAVMQSLHLVCGHEFHRLIVAPHHAGITGIRFAAGLPLLTAHEDFEKTAQALSPIMPKEPDQALVLVGHGTDHPSWTSYPALETFMRRIYGPRVFVGTVEWYPGLDHTLERILAAGFKKVTLVPFLLVAGVHFKEDLTREDDSWQKTMERNGIEVTLVDQGVGHLDGITRIFCDHIAEAVDVIPC